VDVRFRGTNHPLALVVLKREPQLLDGSVASGERGHSMATEIVTRVLHGCLGALECRDGPSNLRMWLTPGACCRTLWASRLLRDGHDLRRWDG